MYLRKGGGYTGNQAFGYRIRISFPQKYFVQVKKEGKPTMCKKKAKTGNFILEGKKKKK